MPEVNRRDLLLGALAGVAGASVACGAGERGVSSSEGEDLATPDGGTVSAWATGGAAALAATYDISFDGAACEQTCELTIGPCYAESVVRQDISEGVDGLPTRLAFRVVDDACNPVEGAVVDVWHAAPSGLYSGEEAANMCTGGDAEAMASRWFRGQQTTDADGVAQFDTCFPGWYSSRAVHIHFQVLLDGTSWVVSQQGFTNALVANIYANHGDYVGRGQPDTSLATDNILRDDDVFEWDQAEDGALILWKTLALRGALSDPRC